jgi:hypothetical protein
VQLVFYKSRADSGTTVPVFLSFSWLILEKCLKCRSHFLTESLIHHLSSQHSKPRKSDSIESLITWPNEHKYFGPGYRFATDWAVRGSKAGRGEISHTRPHRSWDPHSLLYSRKPSSFPGVKRPGRDVNYPPPSIPEVKERIHLYLYPLWSPMSHFRCSLSLRQYQ